MKSVTYSGLTWHKRYAPKEHSFTYKMHFLGLDLSELQEIDKSSTVFGYNRFNVIGIRDSDYLYNDQGSLLDKVKSVLARHEIREELSETTLITCPRLFGYVFNPVSFFLCYNKNEEFVALITEVNNTFDEKHLYVHSLSEAEKNGNDLVFRFPKDFYVSPLLSVDGEYELVLSKNESDISITVHLHQGGERVFTAGLKGVASQITSRELNRFSLRLLKVGWSTMLKIYWEAFCLHFRKKLTIYRKPIPESSSTIRSESHGVKMGLWSRFRLKVIEALY